MLPRTNVESHQFSYVKRTARRGSFCIYEGVEYDKGALLGEGVYGAVYAMTNSAQQKIVVKILKSRKTIFKNTYSNQKIMAYLDNQKNEAELEATYNARGNSIGAYFTDNVSAVINEITEDEKKYKSLSAYATQYVAMKFVHGIELCDIKITTMQDFLNIAIAILSGLKKFHETKKLIHNDLHRGNILIDCKIINGVNNYVAEIIDLNLASDENEKVAFNINSEKTKKRVPPEFLSNLELPAQYNQDYFRIGRLLKNLFYYFDRLDTLEFNGNIHKIIKALMFKKPEDRISVAEALNLFIDLKNNFSSYFSKALLATIDHTNKEDFEIMAWFYYNSYNFQLQKSIDANDTAKIYQLYEELTDPELYSSSPNIPRFNNEFKTHLASNFTVLQSYLAKIVDLENVAEVIKELDMHELEFLGRIITNSNEFSYIMSHMINIYKGHAFVLRSYFLSCQLMYLSKNSDLWCYCEYSLLVLEEMGKNVSLETFLKTNPLPMYFHQTNNVGISQLGWYHLLGKLNDFAKLETILVKAGAYALGFLEKLRTSVHYQYFYDTFNFVDFLQRPVSCNFDNCVDDSEKVHALMILMACEKLFFVGKASAEIAKAEAREMNINFRYEAQVFQIIDEFFRPQVKSDKKRLGFFFAAVDASQLQNNEAENCDPKSNEKKLK